MLSSRPLFHKLGKLLETDLGVGALDPIAIDEAPLSPSSTWSPFLSSSKDLALLQYTPALEIPPEVHAPAESPAAPSEAAAVPRPSRISSAVAGGDLMAPTVTFYGEAGLAHQVVFVIELSGSTLPYIDEMISELRTSIRGLRPTQSFHLVLAKPGRVVEEFAPRRLVPANARYKREALAFLSEVPRIPSPGESDPTEAIKRAFAAGPELICFLTDGDFYDAMVPEREQKVTGLELALDRLNPSRNVSIATITYDQHPRTRAVLERIAARHRGRSRVVESK
jgi:hypothetical protein